MSGFGATGGVIRYTGVDPTSPIVSSAGADGSSSPPYRAPSASPVAAGDLVLRFFGAQKAQNGSSGILITGTNPVYLPRIGTTNQHERTAAAFANEHVSGATTGTFDVTFSDSAEWVAQTVVLKMGAAANVAPVADDETVTATKTRCSTHQSRHCSRATRTGTATL